jgi:hypothetical protein
MQAVEDAAIAFFAAVFDREPAAAAAIQPGTGP